LPAVVTGVVVLPEVSAWSGMTENHNTSKQTKPAVILYFGRQINILFSIKLHFNFPIKLFARRTQTRSRLRWHILAFAPAKEKLDSCGDTGKLLP
jgi:hypothetical protein